MIHSARMPVLFLVLPAKQDPSRTHDSRDGLSCGITGGGSAPHVTRLLVLVAPSMRQCGRLIEVDG